jgi:uncharacterized protein (DUF1684 family)
MYNPMTRPALLAALGLLCFGCGPQSTPDDGFQAELAAYRRARIADLQDPEGWLSLAGLYWLEPGANTFGTDPGNDLVFPAGKAPPLLGTFTLADSTVRLDADPGAGITADGTPVTGPVLLTDADTTVFGHGTLRWFVIRRGDRRAIRLKDHRNPALLRFAGVDTYPDDIAWRVEARFEPYVPPRMLPVPTVLNTIEEQASEGRLVFEQQGETYTLDVVRDGEEERFFLIFGDATNGGETYDGGRYLKTELPDARGRVWIDFNRSYNPPCVFTPYATCPLPVPQNRLALPVTAGELKYGAGYRGGGATG